MQQALCSGFSGEQSQTSHLPFRDGALGKEVCVHQIMIKIRQRHRDVLQFGLRKN